MTAAYKITLLASGLLLLVVVGSLLWQGEPAGDGAGAEVADAESEMPTDASADAGEADQPLPDLYARQAPSTPPSEAGDAGSSSPPPTRIHYSSDPIEPLPTPEEADYPSLDVGRPPFAARRSIFADDYEPAPSGVAEPVDVTPTPEAASADAEEATAEADTEAYDPPADTAADPTDAAQTSLTEADATPVAALPPTPSATALGLTDRPARPAAVGGDAAGPAGGADAVAPPPSSPGVLRLYTIESGDSLSSIALAVYGSGTRWVDIAQANPLIDPNRLKVGQEIKLPDLENARYRRGTAAADDADDLPRRGASYTVQSGDTLSSVAKQFYNSASKWELIYQANRAAIGDDPGNVRVGMELLIPPPANGAN